MNVSEMPWIVKAVDPIKQKLPQSLLIKGPSGLGKSQLAAAIAHSLLCKKSKSFTSPCLDCSECKLIEANTHPDLKFVVPEDRNL